MNDENKSPTDNGQAAVNYVNQQLDQARASLGRTKLVAVVCILAVLAYMAFVTKGILGHLEPTQAAETAKGVIQAQISERGDLITAELKEKIPAVMHDLPDNVLKRMPAIREGLENRIVGQLKNYATLTSKTMEPQFDEFLKNHHKDIQDFLEASQNAEELKADLSPDMDQWLNKFLAENNDGTESLKEKLDQSRDLLNRIAEHTDRLANATDLNDREKQTRKAIAVLLAKADFKLYHATRDPDPEDDPDTKTTTTEAQ